MTTYVVCRFSHRSVRNTLYCLRPQDQLKRVALEKHNERTVIPGEQYIVEITQDRPRALSRYGIVYRSADDVLAQVFNLLLEASWQCTGDKASAHIVTQQYGIMSAHWMRVWEPYKGSFLSLSMRLGESAVSLEYSLCSNANAEIAALERRIVPQPAQNSPPSRVQHAVA